MDEVINKKKLEAKNKTNEPATTPVVASTG